MKLYMVQIGFRLQGMNTEGHDVLFTIANSKEEAFRNIKKARPYADHVDTCLEVSQVEQYEVQIVKNPPPQAEKLWFLNLGGYNEGEFGEVHKSLLLVTFDLPAAKAKAKQDIFFKEPGRVQAPSAPPHIDDKHQVSEGIDDVLCVSEAIEAQGYGIELKKSTVNMENVLSIEYVVL